MTTRKLAGKGGPADPDVTAVLASARTPEPPKMTVKRIADLQRGDWVAADQLGEGTPPAQILDAHPYLDQSGAAAVLVVYAEVGEHGPQAQHLYADTAVVLATKDEVEDIRAHAGRVALANQLRTFADLIVGRELPLRHERLHIHESAGDMERLAAIGAALGLEVKNDHGRHHSVDWPKGHEAYEPGLHVTFYAYAEADPEPPAVDRAEVLTPDGSEPVPVDVQGLALGGGENRPVSAPPADGDQPICHGAPAGFEADCGQPGPHDEHPIGQTTT